MVAEVNESPDFLSKKPEVQEGLSPFLIDTQLCKRIVSETSFQVSPFLSPITEMSELNQIVSTNPVFRFFSRINM